jgi:hypothetical protein
MIYLRADLVATLRAASLKGVLPVGRLHSDTKTVGFTSVSVIWLIGSLHRAASLLFVVNPRIYLKNLESF